MAKAASAVKTIPALVARNRLGQILERVKRNQERFVVSRKGEATAQLTYLTNRSRSLADPDSVFQGRIGKRFLSDSGPWLNGLSRKKA